MNLAKKRRAEARWDRVQTVQGWVITSDPERLGVPTPLFFPGARGGTPFEIYDDDYNLMFRGKLYDPEIDPEEILEWFESYGAWEIRF
jgi:hypothetical protein